MDNNCCRVTEELLNASLVGMKALNELFSLDDPCACIDLYRELLREVIIISDRILDRIPYLRRNCDYPLTILLLIRTRAATIRALAESVLQEDICCTDYENVCYILYVLRDIYGQMCDLTGELAYLLSECKECKGVNDCYAR